MIYVDEIFGYPIDGISNTQAKRVAVRNKGQWCHMWTDPGNEEALHLMALGIGMRRVWFQDRVGFPHYDLTPSRRLLAVQLGAIETSLSAWLKEHPTELMKKVQTVWGGK